MKLTPSQLHEKAVTPSPSMDASALVKKIEAYINQYVSFSDSSYSLPIALWTIGTYLWPHFDAFPYLVITSDTKRSGKTRLSEMISFCCSNPLNSAAMSAAGMFRSIAEEKPTIFFDEAEVLSSESANTLRAVLNVGYRKGQTVRRVFKDGVKDFETYCPKVFILIGDVFDTLKDRSIIIRMRRGEVSKRFTYEGAKTEGAELREMIALTVEENRSQLLEMFEQFAGITFLTDRDEEIWSPLFVIAKLFCPSRILELESTAVDMATEKTQAKRNYTDLEGEEEKAQEKEYSERLLLDICTVAGDERVVGSATLLDKLKALPTGPWRKFKGEGLTTITMSQMLSAYGVRPSTVRLSSRGKGNKTIKGYKLDSVKKAILLNGVKL